MTYSAYSHSVLTGTCPYIQQESTGPGLYHSSIPHWSWARHQTPTATQGLECSRGFISLLISFPGRKANFVLFLVHICSQTLECAAGESSVKSLCLCCRWCCGNDNNGSREWGCIEICWHLKVLGQDFKLTLSISIVFLLVPLTGGPKRMPVTSPAMPPSLTLAVLGL